MPGIIGRIAVYYFPGMYTAILPMIPGIYTIRRVLTASRQVVGA